MIDLQSNDIMLIILGCIAFTIWFIIKGENNDD